MASLQEKITAAWKDAMRAGETSRRDTLSGLRAAIKNQEIAGRTLPNSEATSGEGMSDDAVQTVVNKEAKKRREAITEYQKVGRDDLAAREQIELDILSEFLPSQLSEDELRALVASTIASVGAKTPKDMGAVMKTLQPLIAGKADGKLASNIVKESLAGG